MNRPGDSVRVVVQSEADPARFLVLTETDDPDNWKLPGGKFDSIDETPDAAAARELREELQIDTDIIQLTQAGQLVNDDGVSARYIYGVTVAVSSVTPSSEIAEIRWVTPEAIPETKNRDHILSAVRAVREAK